MSIKNCESCNIKCGFDDELSNLVENNSSFMKDWKNAYKTMDPEEIVSFLSYWVEEIVDLGENKPAIDPLSRGIIINCLFRELVLDHYPGILISSSTAEELIEKMRNKTNPFEKIRLKIEQLIQDKKYDKIIVEIKEVLTSYSKESNEIIDEAINNFLFKIINNFKNIDTKVLSDLTNIYLDFLKNKENNINTAVFFIRLASHLKNEKIIAKNCLLKSKEIYNRLGYTKDVEKVDRILSKFADIKVIKLKPKKSKKTKKKKASKSKRKKKAKKS